ncbi:MAG: lipopolysaccharide heptosyltransferase II [bacterium]|nr:lipopolysaccharide heptosyltransferase II [bacterium]
MRVIIRTPNWLGDAVFNLPFILAVSKKEKVTVVSKEHLKELFWGFPTISFKSNGELYKKHLKIRKKYDYYIITPISFSSALAAYLSKAPERIGFSFDARDFLLTKRIKIPREWKERHTTETYAMLYQELVNKDEVKFELEIPEKYRLSALEILRGAALLEEPFVCFSPFAKFGRAKEWGEENFIELANILAKRGVKSVILGSKGDVERSRIFNGINFVNLTGKTSLWEAAEIARNSLAFIGGDSGLTHLSAIVGARTIAIFGPTPVSWTSPIGKDVTIFYKKLICSPCEKRECPLKTKECMKSVKPGEVFEVIKQRL